MTGSIIEHVFDFRQVSDDGLIDVLVETEDTVRAAQARQLAVIAEIRSRAGAWIRAGGERYLTAADLAAAEIGPVLRLSRHTAVDRVELADTLTRRLPNTLAALAGGEIDLTRVRVIAAATDPLTAADAAAVQTRVLPRAGEQTPPALRAACARAVMAADPSAAHRRHQQAVAERAVRLYPAEDGMATLWARLAAAEALTGYEALRRAAENARTPDDVRSADNRRADTLLDLLTAAHPDNAGNAGSRDCDPHLTGGDKPDAHLAGISKPDPHPAGRCDRAAHPAWPGQAAVHVTAAWTTLAGLDQQPAQLRGYGPITAHAARLIAADAVWRRILTDPHSGTVLDVGHTTYTPPAALAEHIRSRDGHCRFPGCRHPATTRRDSTRLDLDHTDPYPHGPTAEHNLAALCRHHHLVKTHTRWKVVQRWEGGLRWTSPTGQHHPTQPQPADHHPPHAVDPDYQTLARDPPEEADDDWEAVADSN